MYGIPLLFYHKVSDIFCYQHRVKNRPVKDHELNVILHHHKADKITDPGHDAQLVFWKWSIPVNPILDTDLQTQTTALYQQIPLSRSHVAGMVGV